MRNAHHQKLASTCALASTHNLLEREAVNLKFRSSNISRSRFEFTFPWRNNPYVRDLAPWVHVLNVIVALAGACGSNLLSAMRAPFGIFLAACAVANALRLLQMRHMCPGGASGGGCLEQVTMVRASLHRFVTCVLSSQI